MDDTAKQAIAEAEHDVLVAKTVLKIVKALSKVKPHLREAFIEIAAEQVGIRAERPKRGVYPRPGLTFFPNDRVAK